MSNYVKTTDFAAKDALPSGNPNKIAQGTQVDTEFNNIATAVATKEDTANKAVANGYASLDSSGDVPDAQIPATIPRLASSNTFTGAIQAISAATPIIHVQETDAGTDNKNWLIRSSAGAWNLSHATDAAPTSAVGSAISIGRTGTTIEQLLLFGTSLSFNGNVIWHSANDGAGSGLDADAVDGLHASAFALVSHNHAASETTSGTFADARISLSSVQQHQQSMDTRNITGKSGNSKTLSTAAPSGGADGDIWYRYV